MQVSGDGFHLPFLYRLPSSQRDFERFVPTNACVDGGSNHNNLIRLEQF